MRSKYKNRRAGGFDSAKEQKRYQELLLLQRAGKIANLQRQVPYEIVPEWREKSERGPRGGVRKGKLVEKKAVYIADFVYTDCDTEETVVEDVKGYKKGEAYRLFVLKRKLMLNRYGIRIRET